MKKQKYNKVFNEGQNKKGKRKKGIPSVLPMAVALALLSTIPAMAADGWKQNNDG